MDFAHAKMIRMKMKTNKYCGNENKRSTDARIALIERKFSMQENKYLSTGKRRSWRSMPCAFLVATQIFAFSRHTDQLIAPLKRHSVARNHNANLLYGIGQALRVDQCYRRRSHTRFISLNIISPDNESKNSIAACLIHEHPFADSQEIKEICFHLCKECC